MSIEEDVRAIRETADTVACVLHQIAVIATAVAVAAGVCSFVWVILRALFGELR